MSRKRKGFWQRNASERRPALSSSCWCSGPHLLIAPQVCPLFSRVHGCAPARTPSVPALAGKVGSHLAKRHFQRGNVRRCFSSACFWRPLREPPTGWRLWGLGTWSLLSGGSPVKAVLTQGDMLNTHKSEIPYWVGESSRRFDLRTRPRFPGNLEPEFGDT